MHAQLFMKPDVAKCGIEYCDFGGCLNITDHLVLSSSQARLQISTPIKHAGTCCVFDHHSLQTRTAWATDGIKSTLILMLLTPILIVFLWIHYSCNYLQHDELIIGGKCPGEQCRESEGPCAAGAAKESDRAHSHITAITLPSLQSFRQFFLLFYAAVIRVSASQPPCFIPSGVKARGMLLIKI